MFLVDVMVAAVVSNMMMMEVVMMVGGHSAAIYSNGGGDGGQWSNRCLYQGTLVRAAAQTLKVLYHGNMIVQSFCVHVCIFLPAISTGSWRPI